MKNVLILLKKLLFDICFSSRLRERDFDERSYVMGLKVHDEWTGSMLLAGLPDDFNTMIKGRQSSGKKDNFWRSHRERHMPRKFGYSNMFMYTAIVNIFTDVPKTYQDIS